MSRIIISDDQNTVEVDGKKYVAVEDAMCSTCSFYESLICDFIPCYPYDRKDGQSFIFKLQK